MKRILILLLALLALISFGGCQKGSGGKASDTSAEATRDMTESKADEALTTDTKAAAESEITTDKVTEAVTEEVTEAVTEEMPEETDTRVTEQVDLPVSAPVTQSYLQVYELNGNDSADIVRYDVSDSEYAVAVVFEADGDIGNLNICAVEMTEGYDEITETVLEGVSLADGERILVMLDFPGDMSTWYYSYTNNVGKSFEKQLYISGMDGSLISTDWQ